MTNNVHAMAPYNGAVLTAGVAGTAITAAFAFYMLMTEGHAAFNGTSDGVMWGLPVATYVFFVLTSTGLTLVASLAMVFGVHAFYSVAKRCVWLAVATLIAGFAALAFELGHPFRMLWALPLSFQITSPMNWMGVLYLVYLFFLLWKFSRMNAGDWDSPASRNLGVASFAAVVLAHATLGLVFGMMAMRPFWYDGLMPFYFLATAALSGVAFAVLASYLVHGFSQAAMPSALRELMQGAMPKLFAALLGLNLLLLAARTLTGVWSNYDGMQAFEWMVASPWFWIEVIAYVLAFFILLSPNLRSQGNMQLAASVLVILALFIGRYEYVIGGQIVPLFKGAWAPEFIPYFPSATEWALAIMGLALAAAIYAAGEKMFNLSAAPAEKS